MHKQQNSKSTDSLAPKENSPSEVSPAHGYAKIGVFRARGKFGEHLGLGTWKTWKLIV